MPDQDATPSFAEFFEALWSYEPFPWQKMLAERLAVTGWPEALDLPTAAGKTACIDAAVYALAVQAERSPAERTAPRRVWFVVDRRIVVDEAFQRADTIAKKLREAGKPALAWTAARLCRLSLTNRPLAVGRLRGGVLRDDSFARLPSQPAIITSTVDQLGSRLLFRSYGGSGRVAPIHAGLAGNDSLILLDEAHCSVPFMQTLRRVQEYRGQAWAEKPIASPFACAVLTATPPPEIPLAARFPGERREAALAHRVLQDRLGAPKPAELVKPLKNPSAAGDPLVAEAVARAAAWVREGGRRRVAVIVNRVQTAAEIAEKARAALQGAEGPEAHVVMLTGRFRSVERDALTERWTRFLRASNPENPPRPVIFVSTQAIEVGADFSFDALVTECASLDALRQRFGRLNRLGLPGEAPAAILIREGQVADGADDPIYGAALRQTWLLLGEHSIPTGEGKALVRRIDFGFNALHDLLAGLDEEKLAPCLAARPGAPLLLPAHLDLLCQTSPVPHPDPDVSRFLHGSEPGAPEVRVLWRADLDAAVPEGWLETVTLCPPVSTEAVAVPLHRLRSWLAEMPGPDPAGDVESERVPGDAGEPSRRRVRAFLYWRGRDGSKWSHRVDDLRPGDTVVLPAEYGLGGLAHTLPEEAEKGGLGPERTDLWEEAQWRAGRPMALRLHRKLWQPWLAHPLVEELLARAEEFDGDQAGLWACVDQLREAEAGDAILLPKWLSEILSSLPRSPMELKIDVHPSRGLVLRARRRGKEASAEQDMFADEDDLTSEAEDEVKLSDHAEEVEKAAAKLAEACLPEEFHEALRVAATWHDAGKLDERFQLLLRNGDETALAEAPLAKSAALPMARAARKRVRASGGLPEGFRHEMLSVQIAERTTQLPGEPAAATLALHLIASHHGHARPFAPVVSDAAPPGVDGIAGATTVRISAKERAAFPAPHHLASGIAERFWEMIRRHGWWGAAYLETILRLADWHASRSAGMARRPTRDNL